MSARFLVLVAVTASLGVMAVGQEEQVPPSVSDYSCSSANYSDGSQYEKNLNGLVSTLSAAAAANGNGWFYSGSVGAAPDQASGLIMCYADSNVTQCMDCLRNASLGDLRGVCPHSLNMSVHYGECLLRYADANFLGTADTGSWEAMGSFSPGVTDVASMNETRWRLLSQLVASAGDQPLRFLNGSQAYKDVQGDTQVVYGLVQCTRDLRPSECTGCLTDQLGALSGEMTNTTRGSVRGFSCYLRYQMTDPIDIIAGMVAAPAPAPAPAPSPDSPRSSGAAPPLGSKGSQTPLVAAFVAAASTVVALFVVGV